MQLAHSRFLDSESKAQNDCCPRRSRSCCGRSIFSGVSYGWKELPAGEAGAEGGAESAQLRTAALGRRESGTGAPSV